MATRNPRRVTLLAQLGGPARHAVSTAQGRDGRHTVACTCGWWTDTARADTAQRRGQAHLRGGR